MTDQRERTAQKLELEAQACLDTADAIRRFLPELPDWAELSGSTHVAHIRMPFNENLYQELRRTFAGWNSDCVFNNVGFAGSDRSVWLTHESGALRAIISLVATRHGSTCRRVQVGVTEEPVYELVCNDNGGA